ncbi:MULTISPECIES: cellulose biosynthesis protein BcsQ [unclassified Pseudomonas]|uniref:cellulose biosynthesis protein BcsQ n=1 Tax=unclassified Pseudomonas TaxID=196821 RepID=UPI0019149E25|nr:cellulose synthase operon protein YhjQ [Bacillus sp. TH86]MBK5312883.1 cellulose synthase operon protein YhjQ [Pseudomonas sp. TH71]MBK5318380.1 cellulose synthase operon protein YhjQ [Erwinia sp. TH79]MBK5323882.1 cellulose synthase operon protein YhjQ [Bacillus sp. TH59]MBK5338832.1 cellulose synthase operon protein YhjQ [Bacillus sp. TH57]MBK5372087.1 cellulose synthase operon protein YhjQ [Pseudomonas sp. TH40]MBK5383256.1 cellulose synthase operon protein YhjQ [Pseudomonas sp. TH35]M
MKYVDDITKLFTRFGANAENYQEIQPNYKAFKDAPVTPVLVEPEPSVALPPPTPTPTPPVFLLDEPQPSLLIGAPKLPPLTEPPASSATGDRQRLSDLLRELNQVRRDGLPETTRKRTKAKVIAIVSANGGVGKSTVAAGLAKTLRRPGGRTIAIDLDPQNALSSHLGINRQVPGLIQLKEQDADWGAHRLPGYSDSECLPFGTGEVNDRRLLKQLMLEDSDWLNQHLASMDLSENDTVILDTPSGATVYSQQALDAADLVLVMTVADAASYLALDTMTQWLETTQRRAQRHRYVLNQRDDSRSFSRDMGVLFLRRLGADLIGTIRLDHQFNESLAYGRDLLQYAPESIGCQDILSLSGAVHALLFADTSSQQGTP